MVGTPRAASLADEAVQIGHRLAASALRQNGLATWLTDEYACDGATWCRATGTLDGNVGMGTAGVGLFLAQLAVHTQHTRITEAALDAIRHGLARVDAMLAASRYGWFDGALGVTDAATLIADLLDRDDVRLIAADRRMQTLTAMQQAQFPQDTGLLHGTAGILTGLIAASRHLRSTAGQDAATVLLTRVASVVSSDAARGDVTPARPATGLAQGNSGIALPLFALAPESGLPPEVLTSSINAAVTALDAERQCMQPGYGWWCDSPHAWYPWDSEARLGSNGGWCAGAAGIGITRLIAYRRVGEARFLAEGAAAIQVVRDALVEESADSDASLCHGWAGMIESLSFASSMLREPALLDVARTVATERLAANRVGQGYGSGLWPGAQNPSLLFGLAGVGLTLLRLYDPTCAVTPALPRCLYDQQSGANATRLT